MICMKERNSSFHLCKQSTSHTLFPFAFNHTHSLPIYLLYSVCRFLILIAHLFLYPFVQLHKKETPLIPHSSKKPLSSFRYPSWPSDRNISVIPLSSKCVAWTLSDNAYRCFGLARIVNIIPTISDYYNFSFCSSCFLYTAILHGNLIKPRLCKTLDRLHEAKLINKTNHQATSSLILPRPLAFQQNIPFHININGKSGLAGF